MALSFALARVGQTDGTIDTTATITLEKDGDSFTVTGSDLVTTARVPGILVADFQAISADAKANCPISKLLNAEITLVATLAD